MTKEFQVHLEPSLIQTCFFLLPGQSGKLQIFELASGTLLETVDAHDGALWSLCLAPDQVCLPHPAASCGGRAAFTDHRSVVLSLQRGIVTGSADKTVKFWDFELMKDQKSEQK